MDTDPYRSLNASSIAASTPDHFAARHWERTVKQKNCLSRYVEVVLASSCFQALDFSYFLV